MVNLRQFPQMKIPSLIIVSLLFLSCNSNKAARSFTGDVSYFNAISPNDIKLEDPLGGEWRFYHNEAHQAFDDYQKAEPEKAIYGKTKLYLLPLGSFTPLQLKGIELTREYLQIFFQLKTEILEPVANETIPDSARRTRSGGNTQLFTPYIMQHLLKGKIPSKGYALMAISEKDLYPDPAWNYVFGIASYTDRIGVSSIFRYQGDGLTANNFTLFLKRLIGTASHEIGHMFSIHHCVAAKCVMNGSNSLSESDRQTLRLCSECQQKLYWNIGYNNKTRLQALADYFRRNQLPEDLLYLEKDLKAAEGKNN